MDLNQYVEIFLEESKEHLQSLNEKLLLLEKDRQNLDLVNEIFRSAHTLKGMAATMGYESMATLTHEMENVLDQVRNHKKQVDPRLMDTIFHCVDLLEQMILSISDGGDGNLDSSTVINELQGIVSGNSTLPNVATDVEIKSEDRNQITFDEYEKTVLHQSLESGFLVYHLKIFLDQGSMLKSARAYMVFRALEQFGEILKAIPSVEEIENEDFDHEFSVILISKNQQEDIKKEILHISEIVDVQITTISSTLLNEHDKKVETNSQAQQNNQNIQQHHKGPTGKMIRVDIERLDELMNLFSELVIDRGRLEQLSAEIRNSELTDTVEHMSRISSNLQNIILNLRMVPIEQVFNRFPRMIRDLAKELNKKVNLTIIGAETELDRTVIDEIGDPLVHLLRNAIDHGLESVEKRIKNHKPETGEISLKAYHSGNYVFIEISDDGSGIDKEKVLKKAIERQLISQEEARNLTNNQIYNLLFASGLSTADKISDISGRGVGLDVVKSKIEALGGFVSIESELGKGTTFTIQLPLTLSIISAMLVRIQNEKYAIPLSSIIETAIYRPEEIMYAHKQQVIDFRGHIVPLVSLKKVFEVPDGDIEEEDISVVIVRKGEKMAGLIVDSFIGQQEIVLKSLGSYLPHVFAISGATILGDGQVALIIDTNSLIK
ncbi:chemotaxis protein CheA [Tepidibacillus sp. HK-1]|uniref:chemotaxis protein CheA n=1 Tax=Tepidibacillus sp. HK-1 TaxID=1883407 RepID=UPI00085333B9|nr:chemotaxis protein CheA [Tepidibacillus sp. HK-1]GBF11622.1 chemotaxis protein CheA [Tepidibacillus sp. HK-1]